MFNVGWPRLLANWDHVVIKRSQVSCPCSNNLLLLRSPERNLSRLPARWYCRNEISRVPLALPVQRSIDSIHENPHADNRAGELSTGNSCRFVMIVVKRQNNRIPIERLFTTLHSDSSTGSPTALAKPVAPKETPFDSATLPFSCSHPTTKFSGKCNLFVTALFDR